VTRRPCGFFPCTLAAAGVDAADARVTDAGEGAVCVARALAGGAGLATSATGNRPVYVAGDITKPLIGWPTLSCSVGNFDHGSAQHYFDQFVDGGSDYGKSSSSSGCVSAKGRETRWVYGSGSFLSEWVIRAVVSGT